MNKSILAGSALVLALALTGCVPITSTTAPEAKGSSQEDTIVEPSLPEEPPAQPDLNLAFGEAATYDDGLSIAVGVPSAYTPGEYAAGADFPNNLSFTITITNGTSENIDAFAYSTLTSGGSAGSRIFDSNTQTPSGTILPGQAITWIESWSVVDPNALVFSIAPGFTYEDAVFTNVQ